jgi:uncharacterized protein YqjF (DUF2071 family)
MNATTIPLRPGITPSAAGLARMKQSRGEPLFLSDWDQVLMIHLEVEREALQRAVPFPLDLHAGRAFVTLVAFTMRRMRPRWGGTLSRLLFSPIATHHFLNVRTYVKVNGEPGIHFLAEWLSNRLAVTLGPQTFSLPYRHGQIHYQNDWRARDVSGSVSCPKTSRAFAYTGRLPSDAEFAPCERGSLDEWLMERYTAFNSVNGRKRFFRVWHPPWPQCPTEVTVTDDSLLLASWPWLASRHLIGGNYSPGVREVWMGRPRRCDFPAEMN